MLILIFAVIPKLLLLLSILQILLYKLPLLFLYFKIQKVRCHRQSGLVYTCATSVALSYKRIPYTEATHINCLTGSSNTYTGKTPVPDSGTLFAYLSMDKKPYYNGG